MTEQPNNSDNTPQEEYAQHKASFDAQAAASGEPSAAPGAQPQGREQSDIVDELREMGQQLEAAIRAALESERGKQIQRDIAGGVKELTSQVRTALKSVQESPQFQQASDKGRETFNRAQQSKAVNDLQETLVNGLAQLNMQLRKLVDRIEQSASTSGTPSQQVPIEHDTTPATGETTRLDPNAGTGSSETQTLNDNDTTRL